MTYAEQLELMKLLVNMSFDRSFIIWTLIHCSDGLDIGNAMSFAIKETVSNKPFPSQEDE